MKKTSLLLALAAALAVAAWQSVGPDGGYIQAFGIDPQHAGSLFAVPYEYPDNARVFRSTDRGTSWTERGRLPYYAITLIAVDPFSENMVYAGSRLTTLYRSSDHGQTWTGFALPGYGSALAPDPLVKGRLFMSGYYQDGSIYKAAAFISTNSGQTWEVSMPRPDTAGYAYAVAVDPVDTGTVLVGGYNAFLYRTTDAGRTWQRANSGIAANALVQGISVSPADNRLVLAATSAGMFRSTDAGATWALVGDMTMAMSVFFSSPDPAVAYAVAANPSRELAVCVSTDAGATWRMPVPGYTTGKAASLVPDPESAAVAYVASPLGIHRTSDRGANWHEAHAGLRITTISCISASPEDGNRVYLEVRENGVYKSPDCGRTWTRCSDFLSCGNICGIGIAVRTDADVLYALEGSG